MTLHVLHVIDSSEIGGGQTAVRHMVAAAASSGIRASLVCRPGGPLIPAVRALGAETHALEFDKSLHPRLARALARIVDTHRVDVVHAHGLTATYYCQLARTVFSTRVPLVYHQHGFHHHNHGLLTRRARVGAERWLASRADRVVAVSSADRDQLIAQGYASADRVRLVYYGLPPVAHDDAQAERVRRILAVDDGVAVVGQIGRLHPQKGFDVFLRAAQIVARDRSDVVFLVAGVGPLEQDLRTLANALGLGARMRWLCDGTPGVTVAPHLSIGVLASRWEGLPLVLLELMQAGRPVVCSSIPGCLDAVGPNEAEVVAPGNPESLASAVSDLLDAPSIAARKASAGRARFDSTFALEVMARNVLSVYQEIVS